MEIFLSEVYLFSITGFLAFVVPIPVLFYELLVGTIQAVVFAMLTMAFMAIMTTPHTDQQKNINKYLVFNCFYTVNILRR